jgi:hypothetical protein
LCPGLADLGTSLFEGIGCFGRVVPERSHVLFAVDNELRAGVPHPLGIVFRLVDVHHPVGFQFACCIQVKAYTHDHRLLRKAALPSASGIQSEPKDTSSSGIPLNCR